MTSPTLNFEKELWGKGYSNIIGIDEVGRGSWAGPLVAAGVVLKPDFKIPKNFRDSKQLTAQARQEFDLFIRKKAVSYKIVEIGHDKIDRFGLTKVTQIAFRKIVASVKPSPDFVLIDAFHIKYLPKSKQNAIKKGDQLCASIAAASIIAKVYRDKLMQKFSSMFPYYHFEKHKGYGTREHQVAIQKYGFCKIHRTSYNLNFLFGSAYSTND